MNIRKAKSSDVRGITEVHVESWKTTYKGIFPEDFLDSINFDRRYKLWQKVLSQKNEIVYVIEDDNQIIGFISGGPAREKSFDKDGEIYAFYILNEYQKEGLGQKLLNDFFNYLKEKNKNSAYVWVLKENPAVEFYKKMGAEKIKEEEIELANNKYKEIAYGWDHL